MGCNKSPFLVTSSAIDHCNPGSWVAFRPESSEGHCRASASVPFPRLQRPVELADPRRTSETPEQPSQGLGTLLSSDMAKLMLQVNEMSAHLAMLDEAGSSRAREGQELNKELEDLRRRVSLLEEGRQASDSQLLALNDLVDQLPGTQELRTYVDGLLHAEHEAHHQAWEQLRASLLEDVRLLTQQAEDNFRLLCRSRMPCAPAEQEPEEESPILNHRNSPAGPGRNSPASPESTIRKVKTVGWCSTVEDEPRPEDKERAATWAPARRKRDLDTLYDALGGLEWRPSNSSEHWSIFDDAISARPSACQEPSDT